MVTDLHPWSDAITILHAPGKRLAKLVRADGTIEAYDSPFRFNARSVPVSSLYDLADVLRRLLPRRDLCAVRGELVAGSSAAGIRRLAYPCAKTGDAPTLRDVPRRWLALDADGIDRPAGVAAHDLEACADVVLELLPRVFARTAMIVQASASHGLKRGCRLRLWFWCDRPIGGAELMRWLAGTPLDPSIFRPVQPIYTAAPAFEQGGADHLADRLLLLPGIEWLACPSEADLAPSPPLPPTPVEQVARGRQGDAYAEGALVRAADAILNAGEGNRHSTIIGEARSLGRLVRAGLLPEADLVAVVKAAAAHAGKTDEAEVLSAISWGLANASSGKLPEAGHAR